MRPSWDRSNPLDQFYVTISGWFLVTVQQQPVAYIGPNEAVGELCMLDGLPPNATVTASEDCVVLSRIAVSELREQLRVDGSSGRPVLPGARGAPGQPGAASPRTCLGATSMTTQ